MPALNRSSIRMQQNAPGRRLTSLEGRNRVMLPVHLEWATVYGAEEETVGAHSLDFCFGS